METFNTDLSDATIELDAARIARHGAYYGKDGLRDRMRDIRNAVRGQYGNKSPQYLQIRDLKF